MCGCVELRCIGRCDDHPIGWTWCINFFFRSLPTDTRDTENKKGGGQRQEDKRRVRLAGFGTGIYSAAGHDCKSYTHDGTDSGLGRPWEGDDEDRGEGDEGEDDWCERLLPTRHRPRMKKWGVTYRLIGGAVEAVDPSGADSLGCG